MTMQNNFDGNFWIKKKNLNFFFEMNTLFNWSFSFLPIGDCITKRLVKKREEKEWFLNFHMYYIYTTFFLPSLQYIRKFFRPSSTIMSPQTAEFTIIQFQLFVYLHIFMFRPIICPCPATLDDERFKKIYLCCIFIL